VPRGWRSESKKFNLHYSRVGHSSLCDFLNEKCCGGLVSKDPDTGERYWGYPNKQRANAACAFCAVILLGQTCSTFPPYFVSKMSKQTDSTWVGDTCTIGATVVSLCASVPVFHLVREGSGYWLYFPANGLVGSRSSKAACFLRYWRKSPAVPTRRGQI
jgi:hypothetical protein